MSGKWGKGRPRGARTPAIQRIESRVVRSDTFFQGTPCWIFTGSLNHGGYGSARNDAGSVSLVHRITYEVLVGPIPDGLQLDHLCRVRSCCNPAHLEAVTAAVNNLRGVGAGAANAAKRECVNGHPLSGDNLAIEGPGHRRCRTCKAEYNRRYYAERFGAA